jgi:hypothetical protein
MDHLPYSRSHSCLWIVHYNEGTWLEVPKKSIPVTGIPMFFAGGPVWAMAWCPIPLQTAIYRTTHTNQYLAVSCHSGMEDKYISGQSYSHSGLIQIWDFGHLDNQQWVKCLLIWSLCHWKEYFSRFCRRVLFCPTRLTFWRSALENTPRNEFYMCRQQKFAAFVGNAALHNLCFIFYKVLFIS